MALVRKTLGFQRYAFSVQYNGHPFLGFAYQGLEGENCITPSGKDLRGVHSVEGRIRHALNAVLHSSTNTDDNNSELPLFENFQVSSRTDRGVHAWKNTFHVDIKFKDSLLGQPAPLRLMRAMNYHLIRQARESSCLGSSWIYNQKTSHYPFLFENDIRITSCALAPLQKIPNKHYIDGSDDGQPPFIDWNARFTATSRLYLYRILLQYSPSTKSSFVQTNQNNNNTHDVEYNHNMDDTICYMEEIGTPFESNYSWRISTPPHSKYFCVESMKQASNYLIGTHDFTSFRGKKCTRSTPIMTMYDIQIQTSESFFMFPTSTIMKTPSGNHNSIGDLNLEPNSKIITILIHGDAFLYKQVRNIVGCLVQVGKKKLKPMDVKDILHSKDRSSVPYSVAPSNGLFLWNVQHGNFQL